MSELSIKDSYNNLVSTVELKTTSELETILEATRYCIENDVYAWKDKFNIHFTYEEWYELVKCGFGKR